MPKDGVSACVGCEEKFKVGAHHPDEYAATGNINETDGRLSYIWTIMIIDTGMP
jgi:hypothetical protein